MQFINDPVSGYDLMTVEQLSEWEDVFHDFGAKKHKFGFYTVAGWIAEHGKEQEYQLEDYADEEMHAGETVWEGAVT